MDHPTKTPVRSGMESMAINVLKGVVGEERVNEMFEGGKKIIEIAQETKKQMDKILLNQETILDRIGRVQKTVDDLSTKQKEASK